MSDILIFDLEEFKSRYNPIKRILADKEKHSMSRFVLLEVNETVATLKVNSMDSLYKTVFTVKEGSTLKGSFVLEYDVLSNVLSFLTGDTFTLTKEGEDLIVAVLDGTVPLKCYGFTNPDLYNKVDSVFTQKWVSVVGDLETLKNQMELSANCMGLSQLPDTKKLLVANNFAYTNFGNSIIQLKNYLFPVSLRGIDYKFLDSLFKGLTITSIGYAISKQFITFNINNIIFVAFQKITTDNLAFVGEDFKGVQLPETLGKISIPDLSKCLTLISNLVGNYSNTTLELKDSHVVLSAKTRAGKELVFNLGTTTTTEGIIDLHIQTLMSSLLLYKSPDLYFTFDSKGRIVFSSDEFQIIFAKPEVA